MATHHESEMIPHSSAGIQPWGHPPRTECNDTGRVDASPAVCHFDPLPEKSPTPPISFGPAKNASEAQWKGPSTNQPRPDTPSRSSVGDVNSAPVSHGDLKNAAYLRPSSVSWRTRPVCSFQEQVSEMPAMESYDENTTAFGQSSESAPPPLPLPTFPWNYVSPDLAQGGPSRSSEESPKDVQTLPYRIQVPDMAPVLKDKSKLCHSTARRIFLTYGDV